MGSTKEAWLCDGNSVADESLYDSDRTLVTQHDPYCDSEIELKLAVTTHLPPTPLLAQVHQLLRTDKLYPYRLDPFGFPFKSIHHHVFADLCGGGALAEAFVVLEFDGQVRLREKTTAPEQLVAGKPHPLLEFILDRKESERRIATDDRNLLAILLTAHQRGIRPLYIGDFRRYVACIACRNELSGHRYAIVVDQCDGGRPGAMLSQLEIEYIWRRQPADRPFTKPDLYDDICELASLLIARPELAGAGLSPTRLTKFQWLVGSLSRTAARREWLTASPSPIETT